MFEWFKRISTLLSYFGPQIMLGYYITGSLCKSLSMNSVTSHTWYCMYVWYSLIYLCDCHIPMTTSHLNCGALCFLKTFCQDLGSRILTLFISLTVQPCSGDTSLAAVLLIYSNGFRSLIITTDIVKLAFFTDFIKRVTNIHHKDKRKITCHLYFTALIFFPTLTGNISLVGPVVVLKLSE